MDDYSWIPCIKAYKEEIDEKNNKNYEKFWKGVFLQDCKEALQNLVVGREIAVTSGRKGFSQIGRTITLFSHDRFRVFGGGLNGNRVELMTLEEVAILLVDSREFEEHPREEYSE